MQDKTIEIVKNICHESKGHSETIGEPLVGIDVLPVVAFDVVEVAGQEAPKVACSLKMACLNP